MHVFLYAVFAWLLSSVFSNKQKKISPLVVVLVALVISMLQELIQLITIKSPAGWDDIIDILVDISGAIIGISVFRWRWGKGKLEANRKNKSQK